MNYKNINLILVLIIMVFLIIIINTYNSNNNETFTDNHWMDNTKLLRLRPDDQANLNLTKLSGVRAKCPYEFSQVKDSKADDSDISQDTSSDTRQDTSSDTRQDTRQDTRRDTRQDTRRDARQDTRQDTRRDTQQYTQFLQNYKSDINYKYSYYNFSHDTKTPIEYKYDEFNLNIKNELNKNHMKYLFARITIYQSKYKLYEVIKLNTLTHNPNNFSKIRENLVSLINKKILENSYTDLNFFNENKNKIVFTNNDNIKEFQANNKNKEYIFNAIFKTSEFQQSDYKLLEFNILKEITTEEEEAEAEEEEEESTSDKKDNKIENYNFIMRIHRNNKNHHFFIFCNSVINTRNNNIDFLVLKIAGVLSEDNLIFKKMKEDKFNLTNNIDNKPYCKLDSTKNCNFKIVN